MSPVAVSQLSFQQATSFIDSLINYEKDPASRTARRDFNLHRVHFLLRCLGNPQLQFPTIHIAGTKGKGSTAAMLAAMLDAAGYKVGLYTSPHLISPRERIKIGRSMISKEQFAACTEPVKTTIERNQGQVADSCRPTFFEVYTAIAFTYFARASVDIAVIETGLGGRLDATNVLLPSVAIITPISLDHTRQLGNDIATIAQEKAGIIKSNCHVVIGPQEPAALKVLRRTCWQRGASYCVVGQNVHWRRQAESALAHTFSITGLSRHYDNLKLTLPGRHQVTNATSAIAALDFLYQSGISLPLPAIRRGLEATSWPARLQHICSAPVTIIDCAHNEASARVVAQYLRRFYHRAPLVLVLSVLEDKDVEGIASQLCPLASRIILTRVSSPRGLPIAAMCDRMSLYCREKPICQPDVAQALDHAIKLAGAAGVVCVAGSVYLAGEVLALQGVRLDNDID